MMCTTHLSDCVKSSERTVLTALAKQFADVDTDAQGRAIGFLAFRRLEYGQKTHRCTELYRTENHVDVNIQSLV